MNREELLFKIGTWAKLTATRIQHKRLMRESPEYKRQWENATAPWMVSEKLVDGRPFLFRKWKPFEKEKRDE